MTPKQYAVHTVRDEPVRLRDQLDHIAAEGGRVVSIIWQPARQVTLEPGLPPYDVASGYVIVSEHEAPEALAHLGSPSSAQCRRRWRPRQTRSSRKAEHAPIYARLAVPRRRSWPHGQDARADAA
jgi:hypothetical protein